MWTTKGRLSTFPQPLLRPVCPPHFPWGDISTWDKRGHFYFALTRKGGSQLSMASKAEAKPAHCAATNKRGGPCGAPVLRGSRYCYTHSPSKAKERAAARKRGGHNRRTRKSQQSQPEPVGDVGGVLAWVNAALADVWLLENSARRAQTISTLCNTALKARLDANAGR